MCHILQRQLTLAVLEGQVVQSISQYHLEVETQKGTTFTLAPIRTKKPFGYVEGKKPFRGKAKLGEGAATEKPPNNEQMIKGRCQPDEHVLGRESDE